MFCLATESGSLYEVDKEGRSKLWSQPGGSIYTTPVFAGDLILVAPLGADNYLYAYGEDGHQAWVIHPRKVKRQHGRYLESFHTGFYQYTFDDL